MELFINLLSKLKMNFIILFFCVTFPSVGQIGNNNNGQEICYELSLVPDYSENNAKKNLRDSYGAQNVKFISYEEFLQKTNQKK